MKAERKELPKIPRDVMLVMESLIVRRKFLSTQEGAGSRIWWLGRILRKKERYSFSAIQDRSIIGSGIWNVLSLGGNV